MQKLKIEKIENRKQKCNQKAGHQLPTSIDQKTKSALSGSPDTHTAGQAIGQSAVENSLTSPSEQFLCVASINNDPNDHQLAFPFLLHPQKATQLQSIIGHKLNRDKSTDEPTNR